VRCFIAVELPADVRSALARAQETIRARAPRADVRWTPPEQMHLTLKFLGAVPTERVADISAALERIAPDAAPLPLAAGGLGAFPSLGSARVLWAGIGAGAVEAAAVAAAVDRATAALGFPPEARAFRGHLTLGRVRSPRAGQALADAVKAMGAPDFGAWTASELVLFESRLGARGALHVPVSRHALRGGRG
jgi:RNA 2',3'-cyclic 3'-phosphodiesterase